VPYLCCQSCRLTIYRGRTFAMLASTCPRCGGQLGRKPASLFKEDPHPGGDPEPPDEDSAAAPQPSKSSRPRPRYARTPLPEARG
jgi:hypothetical protein